MVNCFVNNESRLGIISNPRFLFMHCERRTHTVWQFWIFKTFQDKKLMIVFMENAIRYFDYCSRDDITEF